ncbi:hypothetical protein QTP88_005332 [Uroleucon formosanum]
MIIISLKSLNISPNCLCLKDEVQENKIFFTVGVYCSYFLQLGNCVNYGHHNMVFLLRHTSYYYYEHGSIITVSNTKPFSKHMPLLHSHQKPGRVATLVEDPQGFVWGKAFLLPDETAFRYLEMREVYLGGYQVHKVDVRSDGADECSRRTVNATVYVATPDNGQWLGEAPVDELATQVASCAGPAGHNAEYVILLARWERQHAPVHRVDVELSKLELLVLERLQSIGVRPDDVLTTNNMPSFSSMVPEKKLRCLNI